MVYKITGLDFVLILLYVCLILAFGYIYSRKLQYKEIQGYFMKGLALKLLCGLGFAWIYTYYYSGGDTTMYFRGAAYIYEEVFNGRHGFEVFYNDYLLPTAGGSSSKLLTQRFAGAVNLFAFNSYWSCTLLFAAISFIGLWLLFISFIRQFPHLHKQLALSILFIPGVIFWSSGIMKDTICMLFVGVIVNSIQNIFLYNKRIIISAVLAIIGFYVIVILKAYIALALLIAIAFYAVLALKSRIRNMVLQVLILPFLSIMIFGAAILAMNKIGESLQKYSLENLLETAQTYQGYHTRTSYAGRGDAVRTGSAYSLGEINYSSPVSIISKVPLAINVTFFRPYVWEVRNPVMMLSALESMALMIFTLLVIRRTGFLKFFGLIFSNKEILFCFTFALIFGFAVGFTTYNFGSLVRYKAPCVPFFVVGLVLLNDLAWKQKRQRSSKLEEINLQKKVQYTT